VYLGPSLRTEAKSVSALIGDFTDCVCNSDLVLCVCKSNAKSSDFTKVLRYMTFVAYKKSWQDL
jgi:hypothetical protein